MNTISKRQPLDVLKAWCELITNEGKNVTDWEKKFVEDITTQLEDTGTLSPRQEEILTRIYDHKTP